MRERKGGGWGTKEKRNRVYNAAKEETQNEDAEES